MIDKNKVMEAKLVSGTGFPNQTHMNSADVVADLIVFGVVAVMTDIV